MYNLFVNANKSPSSTSPSLHEKKRHSSFLSCNLPPPLTPRTLQMCLLVAHGPRGRDRRKEPKVWPLLLEAVVVVRSHGSSELCEKPWKKQRLGEGKEKKDLEKRTPRLGCGKISRDVMIGQQHTIALFPYMKLNFDVALVLSCLQHTYSPECRQARTLARSLARTHTHTHTHTHMCSHWLTLEEMKRQYLHFCYAA